MVATHAGRPRILHLVAKAGATLRSGKPTTGSRVASSSRAATWAGYLSSWWNAQPVGLAADLVDAIGDRRDSPVSVAVGQLRDWGVVAAHRRSAGRSGRLGLWPSGHRRSGAGKRRGGHGVEEDRRDRAAGRLGIARRRRDGVAAAARLVRALIGEFHGAAGGQARARPARTRPGGDGAARRTKGHGRWPGT